MNNTFFGLAACLSALLVLAPSAGGTGDAAGTNERPSSSLVTNRMYNAFSFEHEGDVEVLSDYAFEGLSLTGGCKPNDGIGFGFFDNTGAMGPNYFFVSIEGKQVPSPGEIGEYALDEIKWFNGKRKDQKIGVLMPNAFTGSGTLVLSEHTGRGMNGRMAGMVNGDLTSDKNGEAVSIRMEFDINFACTD